VRKLVESTFVTLGGDIGAPQDWGLPYVSLEHRRRRADLRTGQAAD
jgi:hypothetical protein